MLAQEVDPPAMPVAEAKIVLVAPDSARIGELVRLDVSESVADSFQWLLVPDSVDFEVFADGRKAVFSARTEGDYRFIIACAKDGTVDVITHVVRVIGPPPMPESDSLAEWIPFWLWTYQLPAEQAEALAAAFESVAAEAPRLKTPTEWAQATAEATRRTLGDDLNAWKPILDRIGKAIAKQASEGSLQTPDQHAKIWMEIAEGLRKG
jgi:hypothetical protein